MAYSETLAKRIRTTLSGQPDVMEKKMFGGLAFMLRGNMCCGIIGEELMARVGPTQYDEALSLPHARPMDFTGKPMKGMIYVAADGIATAETLHTWVDRCVIFALSLPAK